MPVTTEGAATVVTEVFNMSWENAQAKSDSGKTYIDRALALAGSPAPHMQPPEMGSPGGLPGAPDLPEESKIDGQAMYDSQRDKLQLMIQQAMSKFITDFFPPKQYYDRAIAWCDQAISTGGTGLDPLVEQQLWERGRARVLGDSERLEDEAITTWANRRFPQPPGALQGQLLQIGLDASRKLAEQSRDISVKSFDQEIENIRFAVKEVIDQRQVSLNAMGDYIKTLMMGPQIAMQLATGLAQIRSEAARNMVSLYQAEVAAADPVIRLAIADAQIKEQAGEANLRSQMATIDAMVRAVLAAAQMMGTQAAAGLNALHASASISGSDITQN